MLFDIHIKDMCLHSDGSCITSAPSHASSCSRRDEMAPVKVLSVEDNKVPFLLPDCEFVSRPPVWKHIYIFIHTPNI